MEDDERHEDQPDPRVNRQQRPAHQPRDVGQTISPNATHRYPGRSAAAAPIVITSPVRCRHQCRPLTARGSSGGP